MKTSQCSLFCLCVMLMGMITACGPAASVYVPVYPVYQPYTDADFGYVVSTPYPVYYVHPNYDYVYYSGFYLSN